MDGTAERGVALVGVDVDGPTDTGGIVTGATRGFACDDCDVPGGIVGCEGAGWGWGRAVGVPGNGPGVSPC